MQYETKFKKTIKVGLKIIFGFIVLVLILFLTYGGWWEYSMYKPLMVTKFSSKKWKLASVEIDEDGYHPLTKRCGMYHDLTRNYLKKGMTIKEVEDLLGEDDTWSYCANKKAKCIMHVMGTCYSNSLSIVPTHLYTCFNSAGKLVTYDRVYHCEIQGIYNARTKEQYCFKEEPGGVGIPISDCGIEPW